MIYRKNFSGFTWATCGNLFGNEVGNMRQDDDYPEELTVVPGRKPTQLDFHL